jgi:tetratricopeptide (TPR) repeat protein
MLVVPQQVKALFLAAAEKVPAERAAFLDEACGSDAELRRRVEQLLDAHDEPGSQPLRPRQTPDEAPPAEPAETVGTIIAGRYKLLQLLGEGGMGCVFMAEQMQPVRRVVALKVVKAGMDSRTVLARFEAERQALALMDHPNIAKVLDAGTTERGQPFFVMELVKGVPLTTFCDQRQLSANDRLAVFQAICQAVQHAHQKGIIHRDLKPSNILVESHDGRAVPKVIDFGLAKAINALPLTERSLFTQLGAMLGTPLYMAPEQAEFSAIDVDTRADIYALGVILYELLTGTTPLEKQRLAKAAWDEIRRAIQEEEPPKPSTRLSTSEAKASVAAQRHTDPQKLGRYVRGELDWIVLKALAKERDRRYQTANAFAADVERFLNHEPVSAGPPTLRYQLRKFVRRNRAAVAVAAMLAVLLLLGAVGLVVGLVVIRAEQQRTAKALAAEVTARQQTREALNAMTDDVIGKLFAKQPSLGENERAFLRKVLGYYQAFAAEKGETEEARAVAADGQFRVAKIRAFLGERSDAVRGYGVAIRLWEQLAADFPAVPEYRHELARSHHNQGLLLADLGKHAEAETTYRQALSLRERLAADFPGVPVYREYLAASHNALGILLEEQRQLPEAEAAYRHALAIQAGLANDFPAEPQYCQDCARTHNNLGLLRMRLGKHAEAESTFRQALSLQEKLAADYPGVPDHRQVLAYIHGNLGLLRKELGKRAEAEAACRRARTLLEKLAADFPAVPSYRDDLAGSHFNLGNLLADRGKHADAETTYRQALSLHERLAADFPGVPKYRHDLAASQNNLGSVLKDLGRYAEAEAAWRQALTISEKLAADFPAVPAYRQQLARAHHNLGVLLYDRGKYPEAEAAYRQALALQDKLAADFPAVPEYRQDLAKSHVNLGVLLADQGKYREAEAAYRQAQAIKEKLAADFPSVPEYRGDLAYSHTNLGNLLAGLGKRAEAEAAYRQALAIKEKLAADFPAVPKYRGDLAKDHNNLGVLLQEQGKRAEAEAAHRQALALREQLAADFPSVPGYRADLAASHNNLGLLLAQQGKSREAEAAYRQAMALEEKLAADFPTVAEYRRHLAGSCGNVGLLLYSQKRARDALEWYAKALPLLQANLAGNAGTATDRVYLRNTHWNRALALMDLHRYAEALQDWDRAIALDQGPQRPAFRLQRAVTLAHAGDHARAVAEADDLTRDDKTSGATLYDAACVYGLSVPAAQDAPLKERYAGQALALLRRAQAAGLFNDAAQVEHLQKDDDLAALRGRADFQQFVRDVQKKLAPRTSPKP